MDVFTPCLNTVEIDKHLNINIWINECQEELLKVFREDRPSIRQKSKYSVVL